MPTHVRKEHLESIRDKFNDLMVSVDLAMKRENTDRLIKAIAVYLLKGGYDAKEESRNAFPE